jgi:putative DNA primase/helicase
MGCSRGLKPVSCGPPGNWGVLLRWKDPDGRTRDWAMPRSLLAGDGLEVRRVLLNGGLYIGASAKARTLLTTYLASMHVTARWRAVTSTGWFGSTFILPDGAVGVAALDEHFILQTAHVVDHAYNIRGSLIEWQHNIARFAVGNSRLALAISTAFAACLVGPCGAESGGIHFRGRSSIGKTTALNVAGSVWGGGDRGFIRRRTDFFGPTLPMTESPRSSFPAALRSLPKAATMPADEDDRRRGAAGVSRRNRL